MRISDWSSDVCSSDLRIRLHPVAQDSPPFRAALARRLILDPGLGIGLIVVRIVVPHRRRIGPWSGSHQLAGVASDNGEPAGQPVQAVVAGQHSLVAPRATHGAGDTLQDHRSDEHTSELQYLMRISYDVFFLKQKLIIISHTTISTNNKNKTKYM